MSITVHHGDCLDVLPALARASFDACVTDPPYHLSSIVKRFGGENAAPAQFGKDGAFARASRGFMGKQWDGGDIAFRPETWKAVFRLLKPGAHLLAFSGTRTYHRMVCAIEDAGFEIRDQIGWLYGSGFPKSHNLDPISLVETRQAFEGWGTALKPAWEPIVLARRPLAERTIAAQVLATGTGALNIDACRIATNESQARPRGSFPHSDDAWGSGRPDEISVSHAAGRWPANVCHDGSDEVLSEFAKYGDADIGTAARFFFSAKAGADDRLSSKHPTVKPVDLMRWLVRMVCPPGGIVLDPFAGTGTTGMACMAEGFDCELIELEAEYVNDIKRRLEHVKGDDTPLFASTDQQMELL